MAAQDSVAAAVRDAGVALGADRCWLYARDPAAGEGVALVRWLRAAAVADVPEELRAWRAEPPDLAARDPLFARALAGVPLDAVDDARGPGVNAQIERALGHRAFVHLNLHVDGVLWGVLQPGMTDGPRVWTPAECARLAALRPALARLVAAAGRGASRLVIG